MPKGHRRRAGRKVLGAQTRLERDVLAGDTERNLRQRARQLAEQRRDELSATPLRPTHRPR